MTKRWHPFPGSFLKAQIWKYSSSHLWGMAAIALINLGAISSGIAEPTKPQENVIITIRTLINQQKVYYLEKGEFASSINLLKADSKFDLPIETANYRYDTFRLDSACSGCNSVPSVQIVALAKKQGLKSYISLVWLSDSQVTGSDEITDHEAGMSSITCQGYHPSTRYILLPLNWLWISNVDGLRPECPERYSQIRP